MEDGLFLVPSFCKPNVPEDVAIELIRRLYGLEVTHIKRLVSFDDQNFHIKVTKEHRNPFLSEISSNGYTLKITNTVKSSKVGHFDSMHNVMNHVSGKSLRTPVPIRNLDGKTWSLEKVPLLAEDNNKDSEPRLCGIHVLTYIVGVPICTQDYTEDLLFQWGLLLAKFHNAVEDLELPTSSNKSVFWNLEHIPEIRKYMEGLPEQRTRLVLSVLDKYNERVLRNMDRLPKGLLHGDFNENNILVRVHDSSETTRKFTVDGVLDYDDVHRGTYAWDLGVLLAYSLLDCKSMDPLDGAGHALAGYLSLRSMSELEISLLKTMIQCRLCQSLVLCSYSHRFDPDNTYLLTSAKTGWSRLEQVCDISDEDLLRKWKRIQTEHVGKTTD